MESGGRRIYSCRNCRNPLALSHDLVSKSLFANSGQAYMFQNAMNVVLGPKQDRLTITGQYSIADINCSKCGEEVGYHYVQAYDLYNKFREGKFVIEKFKMVEDNFFVKSLL